MSQSKRIEDLRQKWRNESTAQPSSENEIKKVLYETSFVKCSTDGDVLKRFSLHLKNGRQLAIPYALLPLFELKAEGCLNVVSGNFKITIKGRNLRKLMDWFCREVVISISESKTGMDTEQENEVFVSSITIEGRAFE